MKAHLTEKPECLHYWKYIYADNNGMHRTNKCRLMRGAVGDESTTCGTLRKNRRCPLPRTKYPYRLRPKGKQLSMEVYK